MPKIDTETLKFILQRNEPDTRKVAGIMQEIELELKAEEEEKALRPPPVKKQNVMLISDPDGKLQDLGDLVGWIVQIPEDDDILTAPGKIHQAAYDFNVTPKGIRMPIETVGEACEVVSAHIAKNQDLWIKTKTPLLVVPVDNKIPTE